MMHILLKIVILMMTIYEKNHRKKSKTMEECDRIDLMKLGWIDLIQRVP